MDSSAPTSHFQSRRLRALPFVVFAVGLGLTIAGWRSINSELRGAALARFERRYEHTLAEITGRFDSTEQALYGARALVDSMPQLPHSQWADYVLPIQRFLGSGVVGVGFVERIDRNRIDSLEARVRADGLPDFAVERTGTNPLADIVTHIEPRVRNAGALGLDIGSGTTRRAAATESMLTDLPIATKRIDVIENETKVPGVLLFLPVYRPGMAHETAQERTAALRGWVYASLRVDLLLDRINDDLGGGIGIRVSESDPGSGETMLYDSGGETQGGAAQAPGFTPFSVSLKLPVFGRQWTLDLRTLPRFESQSPLASLLLAGGILLSVFATGFTWVLVNSRGRALALADRTTADLRQTKSDVRRLALLASRTSNAVTIADADWKIEWVNDSFTRIFGYSAEEAIGRRPGEILHGPETSMATVDAINKAAGKKEAFRGEILNYTKFKQPRWIEVEIQPLLDAQGSVTGYLGLQLDITDRRHFQGELASKEARFRFIFEMLPVGLSWQLAEDINTRIVNPSHVRITGVPMEKCRDMEAYRKVMQPEDYLRLGELMDRMNRKEIDHFTLEERFLRPDKSLVWVVHTVKDFCDLATGRNQRVSTLVEVTELKQQATELRSVMETAERANYAKSQFLATMSHEIRTPMNGVIGMTSLLLDSQLSPDQREYVETIRSSGDTLLTIINDILDFSKIESGRLELEQAEFSLSECVEGALDLLAPSASAKRLDLLFEIAADVPAFVLGDATRLRQIIVNLLGNAIKFTEKGEVVLSVRSSATDDGRIQLGFAVRDTGIGISPDGMQRLFQSFSQIDASTTRRFGGTGLGLAISKRLAELLGGTMWVESELGRGSTFHFVILAHPVPRPVREMPVPKPIPALGSLRLLVVDDNATSRRILATLAAGWGMEAEAAASGAEALSLLKTGRKFDVAILDMQMPEMDGVMLAQAIRRDVGASGMPLVLLSSAGKRELIGDKSIFAAYLSKPAKPSQILDTIALLFAVEPASPSTAQPYLPQEAAAEKHSDRILLAEDNIVNQKVALHMLKQLGCRADVAADGREVLEAVNRQSYDIVLMDVQMPEMDGIEATKIICRERPVPSGRPWIIALTANAMPGDRERCMESGMNDYLAKPIKPAELKKALERAREARRRQRK